MKKRYYFFAFCYFFIGCNHQNPFEEQLMHSIKRLNDLNKNNSSDTLLLRGALDSAYQIAIKGSNLQHDSLFAAVSRLYGNTLYFMDGSKAQLIYQKGLLIGLRQLPPTDDVIFRLYNNTAQLYYGQHDYKTALTYFDSVKINSQATDAQHVKLNFSAMISECYMYLKDPISAASVLSDLEPTARKMFSPQQLIPFYTKYAKYLRLQKKYEEANQKINLGDSIVQNLKKEKALTIEDSASWANNVFEQAHICHESKDFNKSEHYYLKALSIYDQQHDLQDYLYTLRNLGDMYLLDKAFDKADQVLTKGLKIANQSPFSDATIRLKLGLFDNRSEVYLETKQYKKALADHDSAIYFFTLYEKRPSLTAVMMQARPVLLAVLSDKAKVLIALQENGADTEGYQKALKLTQQIIELADDIRADYFSDDAKLTLANDIKPTLERAIGVCQKLYVQTNDKQYLHQAFGFVEYSRSMVLYENARLDNQLPPHLKAENEALKQQEAALIANNNVEALQDYLRLKRQFREQIKIHSRTQLATVAAVQAALIKDDKTAFIEYFVGDSSIFVFTLLKNTLILNDAKTPPDLSQQIQNLRDEIIQPRTAADARKFTQQATALYATLLDKPLAQSPATVQQLIIAPDGVLNYIPFDILIKGDPSVFLLNDKSGFGMSDVGNAKASEKASKDSSFIIHHSSFNFQDCAFLLKHYTISYAYSANLLLEQKRAKKAQNPDLFVGFASKYEENEPRLLQLAKTSKYATRGNSADLKWSREEVQTISTLLGGDAFVSDKATETNFKKAANRYRILHFSMHGLVDDDDPSLNRLLFTLTPKDTTNDNSLTVAELYTMSLNADLAVLSACNTGFGTLNKGEGVMSVARAFTYAGVPATVTSLWTAPDQTTKEIMVEFYKNLQKGMPKDAALRQAKLTYLDNTIHSTEANPYLWAAFVPIGNMDAMDLEKKHPLSILGILVGLALVSGFGFWFWKRKRG